MESLLQIQDFEPSYHLHRVGLNIFDLHILATADMFRNRSQNLNSLFYTNKLNACMLVNKF
jgi:hypothetical protein